MNLSWATFLLYVWINILLSYEYVYICKALKYVWPGILLNAWNKGMDLNYKSYRFEIRDKLMNTWDKRRASVLLILYVNKVKYNRIMRVISFDSLPTKHFKINISKSKTFPTNDRLAWDGCNSIIKLVAAFVYIPPSRSNLSIVFPR